MEKTSLLKMHKQPPDRVIKKLRSVFYYRGDHLVYSESAVPMTVTEAIRQMEIEEKFSGYRLQWRVIWMKTDS